MKNLIIISSLLLLGLNGFGQDYLMSYKEDIKTSLTLDFEKSFSDSTSYFIETQESLVAHISAYDKIVASYFFNPENLCDSIIIDYYCPDCSNKHLNSILKDKDSKWVKVEDNYYITKKKFLVSISTGCGTWYNCGVLKIIPSNNKDVSLKLQFSLVDFDRKEWKKLVKKK